MYSLGVLLFELLTGERPFRGNARMLLYQVIHDEPPSSRRLNAAVPKDLETICLKYQNAFDINQKLAASDPNDAQSQLDLVVSQYKTGQVQQKHMQYE